MALFKANDPSFSYMGRIDDSDPTAPLLIYAGSNISFRFLGASLKITVKPYLMSDYCMLGVIVDGVQYKYRLTENDKEQTIDLGKFDDTEHECMIFKRQAAAYYFRFLNAEAKSVSPLPRSYSLKLEYFGDSVSTGEVTEAIYYEGHSDPPQDKNSGVYDNAYFSYTFSLARKLNAEFHNNSQGGLALLDHTGFFYGPDIETLTGLETTYDKLSYVPYSPFGLTQWDFSRYTPDIVIFAIGQNDHNPKPEAVFDKEYTEKWKAKYKKILCDLKDKYKTAKFIIITTVLRHEPKWDYILDEICAEIASPDVTRYRFRRCGAATDGHPRITEQEEMALELRDHIEKLMFNTVSFSKN